MGRMDSEENQMNQHRNKQANRDQMNVECRNIRIEKIKCYSNK